MLNITYYTDPLCCWSWAFEPQWRRLLFEYEGSVQFSYRMGGLLPAWNSFHDTTNNVSRPIQMGPVWMHAAQISGMVMNSVIWMRDPPASSYPACIAVCTARLQSALAADSYLRLLRQAIMIDGVNIAKPDNLRLIAGQLATAQPGTLDLKKFNEDFDNGNGIEAFKSDMTEVRLHGINRFPALVIKVSNGPAIITTGYRTWNDLESAINTIAPQLPKAMHNHSLADYKLRWPHHTERELAEVFDNRLATV